MERDVEAYEAVNRALKMPKDTEVQRASRKQALDGAFRSAIEPPLRVVEKVSRVSGIAGKLVDVGNPNLITDVGVSAILAEAACAAARLNVEINVRYLGDRSLARRLARELDSHCQSTSSIRDKVIRKINKQLKKKK